MNNKIALSVLIVAVFILGGLYLTNRENEPVVVTESGTPTIVSLSITNDTSTAGAVLAGAKTVNWQTSNYPTDAGVNINLIRKVSDSPRQFDIVRTIVRNTKNDGQESWTPMKGENTSDLYLEVTCSDTYQFNDGCKLGGDVLKVN